MSSSLSAFIGEFAKQQQQPALAPSDAEPVQLTPEIEARLGTVRKRPAPSAGDVNKAQKKEEKEEPETVTWQPPENQSGDGRTSLNAKYGY